MVTSDIVLSHPDYIVNASTAISLKLKLLRNLITVISGVILQHFQRYFCVLHVVFPYRDLRHFALTFGYMGTREFNYEGIVFVEDFMVRIDRRLAERV